MTRFLAYLCALAAVCIVYVALTDALTSPELTARYATQAAARTQMAQEREITRRVVAAENGDTLRTWGMWLAAAGAVVAVAWVGGRTWRHHQEQRTQRHAVGVQGDVLKVYLATCGNPTARIAEYQGIRGVYLEDMDEFVPEDVAVQELEQVREISMMRMPPALTAKEW